LIWRRERILTTGVVKRKLSHNYYQEIERLIHCPVLNTRRQQAHSLGFLYDLDVLRVKWPNDTGQALVFGWRDFPDN